MHAFLFVFLDFYLTLPSLAVYIAVGNDQAASSRPSSVTYLETGMVACARSKIKENVNFFTCD